jgi:hypothetical protein
MPRFPPELLKKYPQMSPDDVPIWSDFLLQYASNYLGFDYNVRVGEGTTPVATTDTELIKWTKILTQKRIDAVGYKTNSIEIFEVKPRAGITALGQVISYLALYRETFNPTLPITGTVVCDVQDPDLADIYARHGIKVVRVIQTVREASL